MWREADPDVLRQEKPPACHVCGPWFLMLCCCLAWVAWLLLHSGSVVLEVQTFLTTKKSCLVVKRNLWSQVFGVIIWHRLHVLCESGASLPLVCRPSPSVVASLWVLCRLDFISKAAALSWTRLLTFPSPPLCHPAEGSGWPPDLYPCFLPKVADMLLELCVTELEDVAMDSQSGRLSSQPVVLESSHPYTDDTSSSGTVKIPGALGCRAGEGVRL